MKFIQPFAIILLIILLTSCFPMNEAGLSTYNPKASAYNVQLGLSYLEQGNRQRAKQKLLIAVDEDPQSASANDALAYYFEKVESFKEAENYYQRAIYYNPQSGAALNNYGAFLCRQKKYVVANNYFLKAANNSQYLNTSLAYENAGLCALASKNDAQAKQYFQMAVAQNPHLNQSVDELTQISARETAAKKVNRD